MSSCLPQRGGLFDRELPFAQHDARLVCEVEENRVVPHAVASSLVASSRTRATSGRVNSGGRSAPSSSSFLTAVPLSGSGPSLWGGHRRGRVIPPPYEQGNSVL